MTFFDRHLGECHLSDIVTRDELAKQHWGMHDASRQRLLNQPHPSKAQQRASEASSDQETGT
jgi:hypothetical protein